MLSADEIQVNMQVEIVIAAEQRRGRKVKTTIRKGVVHWIGKTYAVIDFSLYKESYDFGQLRLPVSIKNLEKQRNEKETCGLGRMQEERFAMLPLKNVLLPF